MQFQIEQFVLIPIAKFDFYTNIGPHKSGTRNHCNGYISDPDWITE